MTADVSSLVRVINGGDANESGKSAAPITKDLLGRCCTLDSKELDLELQVPCGWEKRLDLKSGKVYIERCNSSNSSSSTSENKIVMNKSIAKFKNLNLPPTSNLFDDVSLDLKLASSTSTSSNYQSVCTLDKVKSALERANRSRMKKRSISLMSNASSSSMKISDRVDEEEKSSASFAARCHACLIYVLISTTNPNCPRCHTHLPLPTTMKKPRLDLNIFM